MVALRRVGRQLEASGRSRRGTARSRMSRDDQVGVLALPAEPGLLRQRLLHHRRGVDEDLELAPASAAPIQRASAFSRFFTVSW